MFGRVIHADERNAAGVVVAIDAIEGENSVGRLRHIRGEIFGFER